MVMSFCLRFSSRRERISCRYDCGFAAVAAAEVVSVVVVPDISRGALCMHVLRSVLCFVTALLAVLVLSLTISDHS